MTDDIDNPSTPSEAPHPEPAVPAPLTTPTGLPKYRLKGLVSRYSAGNVHWFFRGCGYPPVYYVNESYESTDEFAQGDLVLFSEGDESVIKLFCERFAAGPYTLHSLHVDGSERYVDGWVDQQQQENEPAPVMPQQPVLPKPAPATTLSKAPGGPKWVAGQSLKDLTRAALPQPVLDELKIHADEVAQKRAAKKAVTSKNLLDKNSTPKVKEPYSGVIPNFVMADWDKARPCPKPRNPDGSLVAGRPRLLSGIYWAVYDFVIAQKRSNLVVPDRLLAQAVWGGDTSSWPSNWRKRLAKYLNYKGKPSNPCPEQCPLVNRGGKHKHFLVKIPTSADGRSIDQTFLGKLDLYGWTNSQGVREYVWSFGSDEDLDPNQDKVAKLKKAGAIWAVYLPALVFGPSPRSGLKYERRQILIALTRETTRGYGSQREERAQVLTTQTPGAVKCPNLKPGVQYVAFNGNARYKMKGKRGQGYMLIGKTQGGWLPRAGYEIPTDPEARWKAIRAFLLDLQAMSSPFGLVVGAWNTKKREWLPLSDLLPLTKTKAGRAWLNRCLLRIYTPADYLIRWRHYFADKMGFSFIPGDPNDDQASQEPTKAEISSAVDLKKWMKKNMLTDAKLAVLMKRSTTWVRNQRTGTRTWSTHFQRQVNVVAEQMKQTPEQKPESKAEGKGE